MPKSAKPDIKDKVRKQYAKIALSGNSNCCCMPGECGPSASPVEAAKAIGYDLSELQSVPEESILGVGCGAPLNFADIKLGETVVDLGSGAGIDAFISANKVGSKGRIIGIDMTDEMLRKAQRNAAEHSYSNVEFRKGDIESDMPVDSNSVDLVISNCVINLTTSKVDAFRQVNRILKQGGRMVISDLVTDKEVKVDSVNEEKWCSCIDGALTRDNYLGAIRAAGFKDIEVLQEKGYIEGAQVDGRRISSLVIRAVKP